MFSQLDIKVLSKTKETKMDIIEIDDLDYLPTPTIITMWGNV